MTKRQSNIFVTVGLIICVLLIFGLSKQKKYYKEKLQEEIRLEKIEEEKKEYDIPPIEAPKKDKTDNDIEDSNVPEYKEEIKEVDGNKVLVKPTPTPKEDEKLPEGMEKPKTEPKPTNPPKPVNTETADKKDNKTTKDKNSDKPPAYKEEEKPKVVNGGTGSDGVLRDLNGNPIHVEGDPNAKPNIVNGSDLLDDGEVAGQGDKF